MVLIGRLNMSRGIKAFLAAGACVLALGSDAVFAQRDAAGPEGRMQSRTYEPGQFASRFFEEFDLNHDGKVTHDEMNKALAARFAAAAHGGAMTSDQFAQMRLPQFRQRTAQMFRRLDWNGDGRLSLDEFAGPQRARFEMFDPDGKGSESCAPGSVHDAGYRPDAGRYVQRGFGRTQFCAENDLNHDLSVMIQVVLGAKLRPSEAALDVASRIRTIARVMYRTGRAGFTALAVRIEHLEARALRAGEFVERKPAVAVPVQAAEHLCRTLAELRQTHLRELVGRHRPAMGRGSEAGGERLVHFVVSDLAVMIEVEFLEKAARELTGFIRPALHPSLGPGGVPLGENRIAAERQNTGAGRQKRLDSAAHVQPPDQNHW